MQIVIEIPEETYHEVAACGLRLCPKDESVLVDAVTNGIVLPKHGRLIDADKLKMLYENRRDNFSYYGNEYESAKYESYDIAVDDVDDAPTILEETGGE